MLPYRLSDYFKLLCVALSSVALLSALPGCKRHVARATFDSGLKRTPPARPATSTAPARSKGSATAPGGELLVRDLSFAGPAGHRPGANFARGERVVCLMTLARFTYRDRRADLAADIEVRGPDDQTVLVERGLTLLRGKAPTLTPGQLRTAANLNLSPAAPPGRYHVAITVRDRLGHREGQGVGQFTILGTPRSPAPSFAIANLRAAADQRMPAGSVMPLSFDLRGFAVRAVNGREQLDIGVVAQLVDAAGKVVARQQDTLLRQQLLFRPVSYPVSYGVVLPREVIPGRYRVVLELRDRVGQSNARGEVPLEVSTGGKLGIYNLHLNDAGGLPRRSFRLGEQIFVRLAAQGFRAVDDKARLAIDLAIGGHDGGVYLARKDAVQFDDALARTAARSGRYAVQVPIVLPALAPVGSYRLLARVRDLNARRDATAELRFHLQGEPPPPAPTFTIDKLQVRLRPDLPPIDGASFVKGRSYELELRIGGIELKKLERLTYQADVEAKLQLLDLRGKMVNEHKRLFRYRAKLHYRPLRIVIPTRWTVPAELPPGLYDLRIEAINRLDDHASQLIRRVAIHSADAVVPVRVP